MPIFKNVKLYSGNEAFKFVLNDNILRRLLFEIDTRERKMLINYCNPLVFAKYSVAKKMYGIPAWRELIFKDPFFINPRVWLKAPVINQNNKLFKNNQSKRMDLITVVELIKQWLNSDCERAYFLNVDNHKHMQEILIDTYNTSSETDRNKLIANKNGLIKNYLNRGIIVLCVDEGNNPLDAHYVCFFKDPEQNSTYTGITTLNTGLDLII